MLLQVFTLIINIYTRKVTLAPKDSFVFEKELNKDQLCKFEFYDEHKGEPHVIVYDDKQRDVINTRSNYSVIHWAPVEKSVFTFEITNSSEKEMKIYFNTPDVNKEIYSALGPIKDKDVLYEFDAALKRNIQDQRNYLQHLKEHEDLTTSVRRKIGWLIVLEIVSCAWLVYYLHNKTLSLFEKRQRA